MINVRRSHLDMVKQILAEHVPECEVRVFGSRIKGTTKRYADLDLVIVGKGRMERNQLDKLAESFAELDSPFRVDVLDWFAISDDFRKLIDEKYEIIQKPNCEIA